MQPEDRVIGSPAPLVAALIAQGWRVVGPVERDGAIALAPLSGPDDLPRGRCDMQGPGRYRLGPGEPDRWFDYVVGPQGWKPWLFPPRRRLFSAERTAEGFELRPEPDDWPPTAFFGARACELAAMAVQDRVFAEGAHADPHYARRRAEVLVIAVQCARAADTCFCASMGTGPRAGAGFDLALTELDGRFLVETGTARGAEILAALDSRPATAADRAAARAATARAAAQQTRRMPAGIADALADAADHPRWQEIASRCLGCANCTLACPTCFCSDVEDSTDLTGDHAERWQSWDSCFGLDFSLVGGGSVRRSTAARYRQWMTHKLSSWHAQFGSSGCVGCGRCVTWCPVGIDITAEAVAFARHEEEV